MRWQSDKAKKILDELIEYQIPDYLECRIGHGWYRVKELTEEYVILSRKKERTEIKYFFDFTETDDKILYHLFSKCKEAGESFYISIDGDLPTKRYWDGLKEKKLTYAEKKDKVEEMLKVLGSVDLGDTGFLDDDIYPIGLKIFKDLKKEGKLCDPKDSLKEEKGE